MAVVVVEVNLMPVVSLAKITIQKIGANYKEMLKSDPTNSLMSKSYGKYLHEVVIFTNLPIFLFIKVYTNILS